MIDRHHVLYNAREWECRPQYKEVRTNSGLIIPMDREVHNELHRNTSAVPVIGYHAIQLVRKNFEQGDTHLETVDNLLSSLDHVEKSTKLSKTERALAAIALECVEDQVPYIKEGIAEL